jgi:hypothetical protein
VNIANGTTSSAVRESLSWVGSTGPVRRGSLGGGGGSAERGRLPLLLPPLLSAGQLVQATAAAAPLLLLVLPPGHLPKEPCAATAPGDHACMMVTGWGGGAILG